MGCGVITSMILEYVTEYGNISVAINGGGNAQGKPWWSIELLPWSLEDFVKQTKLTRRVFGPKVLWGWKTKTSLTFFCLHVHSQHSLLAVAPSSFWNFCRVSDRRGVCVYMVQMIKAWFVSNMRKLYMLGMYLFTFIYVLCNISTDIYVYFCAMIFLAVQYHFSLKGFGCKGINIYVHMYYLICISNFACVYMIYIYTGVLG